nr:2-oxo acid dehydrogenase subunit E2 [Chloroflexota bacterium]
VRQIACETKGLAERARSGKSRVEDYAVGTFTVSNLGMFGIDTFIAIINPPQAAILAVGAVRRLPVYVGDDLVPRERMSVTLSADHRVTDGATAAQFLSQLRSLLENPLRLLV